MPSFFFFNDTATTEIYTLSLHDALPIWPREFQVRHARDFHDRTLWREIAFQTDNTTGRSDRLISRPRSEEHTSELQSQSNLVCRLLLEKKNKTPSSTTSTSKPRVELWTN